MNVGDRFTEEVADVLIEAFREDGIVVEFTMAVDEAANTQEG
jgi:hypothetical protein